MNSKIVRTAFIILHFIVLQESLAGRANLVKKVLEAYQVGLVVQVSLARKVNLGTLAMMVHKEPRVCLGWASQGPKASQETKVSHYFFYRYSVLFSAYVFSLSNSYFKVILPFLDTVLFLSLYEHQFNPCKWMMLFNMTCNVPISILTCLALALAHTLQEFEVGDRLLQLFYWDTLLKWSLGILGAPQYILGNIRS